MQLSRKIRSLAANVTILLIGVCASLGFYFITDTVIDVKIQEQQKEREITALTLVQDEMRAFEEELGELVSVLQFFTLKELSQKDKKVLKSDKLSSLFWIESNGLENGGMARIRPILNRFETSDFKTHIHKDNINIFKSFYKNARNQNAFHYVNIPRVYTTYYEKNWLYNDSSIVLAAPLTLDGGSNGLVVAVSSMKKIFKNVAMLDALDIQKISVSEGAAQKELFEAERIVAGDRYDLLQKLSGLENKKSYATYANFSNVFKISLEQEPLYTMILLDIIPEITLIFSFLLTIIYTIMRQININRAYEMKKLNVGLAEKNVALRHEIKKREKMNLVIRQSEQENKAIINGINEIIVELDEACNICFVNDAWRRVSGHELADTVGNDLFSYFSGNDIDRKTDKIKAMLEGHGKAFSAKYRLKTKEGFDKPVELSISMVRQDKNLNTRIVGTITDLDEKEKAALAIEKAEEDYKRIWKNAANGIYELSLEGYLLSANPAMAKILGYETTQSLIGQVGIMTQSVYVTPQEKDEKIKAVLQGEPQKFEIEARRKDGQKIWLSESIQPVMNDTGKIVQIEGSIDDITERKQANIDLMKAKAESDMANRAKSDFLANMSHELRTPLNSIMGFAEVIRDQVMGEIKEPVYIEYADEIHKSGKGLLSIITQILDVSKIESGDRELNESLVKFEKVSSETIQMFSEKIRGKQIQVTNNIAPNACDLIAEERSVRQMLYNLLSNAVKFTPIKGKIALDLEIDSQNVAVKVSDNGQGLTQKEVERALKPFDLLDGEHSREKYGAGLGLTLVKLLMDMHGGRIDIQSEKNVGTTVSLVFPIERLRKSKKKTADQSSDDKKSQNDMPNIEGADVFDTSSSKSIH